MRPASAACIRAGVVTGFVLLIGAASIATRQGAAGQAAVSLSRPGQEDLSFWVNHNGLVQFEAEGEVGFGDLARVLLRRRGNAPSIARLRDRFTFRVTDPAAIDTPDLFRADFAGGTLSWRQAPATRFVSAASRTFNIPLVVANRDSRTLTLEAVYRSASMESAARDITVRPGAVAAIFLRAVETQPGAVEGTLTLRHAGGIITAPVRFDIRPLVALRVHIRDENDRPVTARIYLTGSDGLAYAPFGASARVVAMDAEYYFHAQDTFEIEMPAGETSIEAARGPEYHLASEHVILAPGKPADVTLQLVRWTHPAAQGYWSADVHIHANYTAPHHQVISPNDVRLQVEGEDLNYANMMVANSGGNFIHDREYFEGRPSMVSSPGHFIYWNEENRSSAYGHMCFMGLHRLVEPFYNGFRDTPYWDDYPANYPLAQQVFDQGGVVSYAHPGYHPTFEAASIKELPADLALGQNTAMDVLSNNDENATTEMWYRLLNCGFRVAISAGTDSFTNVADHYVAGGGRVYVKSGAAFDYIAWMNAYRRGRSFASNGPVVELSVDGKEPGDEIKSDAAREVEVRAKVVTQVPLDSVDLVVNGTSVYSAPVNGTAPVDFRRSVRIDRSSWIALRALGPRHRLVLNDAGAWAHTSPVYVTIGGRPVRVAGDLRFYREWVERLIARAETAGRFATPERRNEVVALFRKALDWYRAAEDQAATDR